MRPLRSGAARSGLATGLETIAQKLAEKSVIGDNSIGRSTIAQLQAAVAGGAVEQALQDLHPDWTPQQHREYARDFWRLTNENLWRLTRTLEASGSLDKAGQ